MNLPIQNFDTYAFSKQSGYHEPTVRKKFAKAVSLRTVVIYCYDPRAVGIPAAHERLTPLHLLQHAPRNHHTTGSNRIHALKAVCILVRFEPIINLIHGVPVHRPITLYRIMPDWCRASDYVPIQKYKINGVLPRWVVGIERDPVVVV